MRLTKLFKTALLVAIFSMVGSAAYTPPIDAGGRKPKLATTPGWKACCGGNYSIRSQASPPVTELNFSKYNLRNHNGGETITIRHIDIYDATGTKRCRLQKSASGGALAFPAGFRDELGPTQSTGFDIRKIGCFSADLPDDERRLQVFVYWKFKSDAELGNRIPLKVSHVRLVRDNSTKETKARASGRCDNFESRIPVVLTAIPQRIN
jgi:hypothetical protein